MNAKLKSITAKVIGIDSSKASIMLENQNKQYRVQLSDLFLDSFNQIEFILRASDTAKTLPPTPDAKSALCIIPSGKPPTDIPDTVPDPFNVIGIIYTIVQFSPVPIVTATPLLIVTGPADIAL